MWIEMTTEDGELLKRVHVAVNDDPFFPVGRGPAKAELIGEIESAARSVQRLEAGHSERTEATAAGGPDANGFLRRLRMLRGRADSVGVTETR
jgi:hypothetical protein